MRDTHWVQKNLPPAQWDPRGSRVQSQAWAVQTRLPSEDWCPKESLGMHSHQGTMSRAQEEGGVQSTGERQFYSFKKMYQQVEGRSKLAKTPVLSRGLR